MVLHGEEQKILGYEYRPPVDRLLSLGMTEKMEWDWPDYLAMGLGEADIAELIRMATDERLNNVDGNSPEV